MAKKPYIMLTNLTDYDGQIKAYITSKIPTKTSDLSNDSGFITKSVSDLTNYYTKTDTYTQTEVNQLIGAIEKVTIQIVQELPETGQSNIIYFVPKTTAGSENVYDEYIWITGEPTGSYELIGSTDIDLSGYEQTSNKVTSISSASTDTQYPSAKLLYDQLALKQDTLTIDATPTENSTNPVQSGGVYTALAGKASTDTATTTANGLMSSTDKAKLDGIETGAEENVIETVKLNGTALTPDSDKAVDIVLDEATTYDISALFIEKGKQYADTTAAETAFNIIVNTTAFSDVETDSAALTYVSAYFNASSNVVVTAVSLSTTTISYTLDSTAETYNYTIV